MSAPEQPILKAANLGLCENSSHLMPVERVKGSLIYSLHCVNYLSMAHLNEGRQWSGLRGVCVAPCIIWRPIGDALSFCLGWAALLVFAVG